MIWLIVLGILLFYGGYILCGLLTRHKDDRIQELESLVAEILEASGKKFYEGIIKEETLKKLEAIREADGRIRPQSRSTH